MAARRAVIGADADEAVDAAFCLGIAIGALALDVQRRRLDPGLLARLIFDRLDLEAAPLGPAAIHAEQHFGPVLALGPARAGVDFEIGVVSVRLARQKRLNLVGIGPVGKRGERGEAIIDDRIFALGLAQFDELDRVGHFGGDFVHRVHRGLERLLLAADRLRLLGIVPEVRVLHARIQLVQAAQRAVPVERQAHQRQRRFDPVDVSLGLGPHRSVLRGEKQNEADALSVACAIVKRLAPARYLLNARTAASVLATWSR